MPCIHRHASRASDVRARVLAYLSTNRHIVELCMTGLAETAAGFLERYAANPREYAEFP